MTLNDINCVFDNCECVTSRQLLFRPNRPYKSCSNHVNVQIWTRNMYSAVHSIEYVKNQFLFYRMFQSLWSVWRAFWRDMIIKYMHIWTRNMYSAVHSIGYVKNKFLFYRLFQSLWSVWRVVRREMIIKYMHIWSRNM